MTVIEADDLTFRYGRHTALDGASLAVPDGAIYALVGANGAGKTTLMQILRGLRRPTSGRATILGKDPARLSVADRASVAYVAEGMSLPHRIRLGELEAYLAPLYPRWDRAFADELRQRFRLDPRHPIGALSRGEQMKAAILCALAPRPRLLFLDEPFTGIDVVVKDELIRGLLASAQSDGWSALICSHDISELEMLADWLGVLDAGQMMLSAPLDRVRERFLRADASFVASGFEGAQLAAGPEWLAVERAGTRVSGLLDLGDDGGGSAEERVRELLPGATRIEIRPATLREIVTTLAAGGASIGMPNAKVAA